MPFSFRAAGRHSDWEWYDCPDACKCPRHSETMGWAPLRRPEAPPMRDYIVKRLLLMIPAIVIVSIMSFSLVHLVPGDVVMAMLAEAPNFKQEDVDALRHELGLDRPLHVQYFVWLFGEQREIAKP